MSFCASRVILLCILTTRCCVHAVIFQPLAQCPLPVDSGNEAGDVREKLDDSVAVKYFTIGNNVCSFFFV